MYAEWVTGRNTLHMDQEERCEAILSLYPMCKHEAWRYWQHYGIKDGAFNFEDTLQWAVLGAIEAVDKHDPSRGAKLSTYAVYRIRGTIIDEVRLCLGRKDYRKTAIPMDPRLPSGVDLKAGETIHVLDTPILEQGFEELEYDEIMNGLPTLMTKAKVLPRHQKIMLAYIGGQTLLEIGEDEGCTESRICQIVNTVRLALYELHSALNPAYAPAVPYHLGPRGGLPRA